MTDTVNKPEQQAVAADGVPSPSASAPVRSKHRVGSPEWLREMHELEVRKDDAKVYQLAFWPEDKRAMPTDFLACAMFAGVHIKNAPYLRGEEIASINGYTVSFTGKRLTQVHADIVMGALQLMRGLHQGNLVRFRTRNFLRLIGRSTGKTDRDSFRQLVDDVIATSVRITTPDGKLSYSGSILTKANDATGDDDDSVFVLEVNRELAKLFERGFSTIDWEKRQKLMRKPLALWLQLYFSTFTKPVAVSELHRLSGSTAQLKGFRRQLHGALEELEQHGIAFAQVDEQADTVRVTSPAKRLSSPAPRPAAPAVDQPVIPGLCLVSPKAMMEFRRLYPDHDAAACLADFQTWLAKNGHTANKPDAAFLGYARKWVS